MSSYFPSVLLVCEVGAVDPHCVMMFSSLSEWICRQCVCLLRILLCNLVMSVLKGGAGVADEEQYHFHNTDTKKKIVTFRCGRITHFILHCSHSLLFESETASSCYFKTKDRKDSTWSFAVLCFRRNAMCQIFPTSSLVSVRVGGNTRLPPECC